MMRVAVTALLLLLLTISESVLADNLPEADASDSPVSVSASLPIEGKLTVINQLDIAVVPQIERADGDGWVDLGFHIPPYRSLPRSWDIPVFGETTLRLAGAGFSSDLGIPAGQAQAVVLEPDASNRSKANHFSEPVVFLSRVPVRPVQATETIEELPTPAPSRGSTSTTPILPAPGANRDSSLRSNFLPFGQPADALTSRQAEAVAERITQEATADVEAISSEADNLIAYRVRTALVRTSIPANDQQIVAQALRAGVAADAMKILDRNAGEPVSPGFRESVVELSELSSNLTDLLTEVESGAASVQLRPLVEKAKLAVAKTMGAGGPTNTLDMLRTRLSLRDALLRETAPNPFVSSTGAVFPSGDVLLFAYPRAPQDRFWVAGDRFIVMGTSEQRVTIAETTAAKAAGLPAFDRQPLPDANSTEVQRGVVLVNPSSNRIPLGYSLNNYNFTIQPGSSQALDAEQDWRIRFYRTGRGSVVSYSLTAGTYRFDYRDGRWDLYKKSYRIVLDNGQNPLAFYYSVDGEEYVLAPGEARRHESEYPIIVRFDAANGTRDVAKRIIDSGTYRIGVDPRRQRWDLYPGN